MRLHVSTVKKFKPSSKNGFTHPSKAVLPLWIIFCYLYFMFSLQSHGHQLGRTGLLARLYVKLSCVFVSFPCGVLGQVWCLIVLISDLCILTYLVTSWVYVLGLFSHCR